MRAYARARILPAIAVLFFAGIARAKQVHLVPPQASEHPFETARRVWSSEVFSIAAGDTVFLDGKIYHVGKYLGYGSGAVIFMDADSRVPAVIKFRTYPDRDDTGFNSLKVEYDSLKELERNGYPVAKALELGPMGLTMRQEYKTGGTVDDFFETQFWEKSPEQREKIVASLDGLYRSMVASHLLTSDLHGRNILIDPKTMGLTIVDPGKILPDKGVEDIAEWEKRLAGLNFTARSLFEHIQSRAACLGIKESMAPGRKSGK